MRRKKKLIMRGKYFVRKSQKIMFESHRLKMLTNNLPIIQYSLVSNLTSTLGTWRPIVFNALRLMNNVQMTKIC